MLIATNSKGTYKVVGPGAIARRDAVREFGQVYRAVQSGSGMVVAFDEADGVPFIHPGQRVKNEFIFTPGATKVWVASGLDSGGLWTSMHGTKEDAMEALDGYLGGDELHVLETVEVPEIRFLECQHCDYAGWTETMGECPACSVV